MSVTSKDWGNPQSDTGSWESTACCATLQTETLGYQPSYVCVITGANQTSPNRYERHAGQGAAKNLLTTGTTGVVTLADDANAITLVAGSGFTFAAAAQTAGDDNWWIALR